MSDHPKKNGETAGNVLVSLFYVTGKCSAFSYNMKSLRQDAQGCAKHIFVLVFQDTFRRLFAVGKVE